MKIEERLIELQTNLKGFEGNNSEEAAYYTMLIELCKELKHLLQLIDEYKLHLGLRKQIIASEPEGKEIITAICEVLENESYQSFALVKNKKMYEVLDECMADLDDWIESLNEDIEAQGVTLPYIEAWDIGLFF